MLIGFEEKPNDVQQGSGRECPLATVQRQPQIVEYLREVATMTGLVTEVVAQHVMHAGNKAVAADVEQFTRNDGFRHKAE
ncbi:hypothetical protein D3C86_1831850 [compost metagenome]